MNILKGNITQIRQYLANHPVNRPLLLEFERNNKNRKGVIQLLSSISKGKEENKKREEVRVSLICHHMNNNTELGNSLKNAYLEQFGKIICRVEQHGGRHEHYDFLIYHQNELNPIRCEEKGSDTYQSVINSATIPWENSVEFYNGTARNFSISDKYLRLWYHHNVINLDLSNKLGLSNIPTYEEWRVGGPDCMVNPSGGYNQLLKKKYRELYPGKSMNGYQHEGNDYRMMVNRDLLSSITEEDKRVLLSEVNPIYRSVMEMKDCWLQTTGIPGESFSFRWYDKINTSKLVKVDILVGKDIELRFYTSQGEVVKGIMRWGKGCGFSCFRLDLR